MCCVFAELATWNIEGVWLTYPLGGWQVLAPIEIGKGRIAADDAANTKNASSSHAANKFRIRTAETMVSTGTLGRKRNSVLSDRNRVIDQRGVQMRTTNYKVHTRLHDPSRVEVTQVPLAIHPLT